MTEFYQALLDVTEREETEKAIAVVEHGKRRELDKAADDMDVFTRMVQPGRIQKLYDADHPTDFEQEERIEDDYPCLNSAMIGFIIGILTVIVALFIAQVNAI
jgi:hypothetical protein